MTALALLFVLVFLIAVSHAGMEQEAGGRVIPGRGWLWCADCEGPRPAGEHGQCDACGSQHSVTRVR